MTPEFKKQVEALIGKAGRVKQHAKLSEMVGVPLRMNDECMEFVEACNPDFVSKLCRIVLASEEIADMVEHAIELGHLGEGSTKGWAEQCLAKFRAGRGKR